MARLGYDDGKDWMRAMSMTVPNPLNGGATKLKLVLYASSVNPDEVQVRSVKEGGKGEWVDADYLKDDPGIQAFASEANMDRETRRFLKKERS